MQKLVDDPETRMQALKFIDFMKKNYKEQTVDFVKVAKKEKQLEKDLNSNVLTDKYKSAQELVKKEVKDYSEILRAAKVTSETKEAFLIEEELITQLNKENYKKAIDTGKIKGKLKEADISEELYKKNILKTRNQTLTNSTRGFGRATQVFREIDDKVGTDFEIGLLKIHQQTNKQTGFERKLKNGSNKAKMLRWKEGKTQEEIYDLIKDENYAGDIVVDEYRKIFKNLLKTQKEYGLDIGDAGDFYVPQYKKSGIDRIAAVKQKADELDFDQDLFDEYNEIKFKRVSEESEDPEAGIQKFYNRLDKEAKTGDRSGIEFIELLEEMDNLGLKIQDEASFNKINNYLKSSEAFGRASNVEVSALFTRRGKTPEWLLEKDIDKLINRQISQAGRQIFIEPVAKSMLARKTLLDGLGYKQEAKYVHNYINDMLGLHRHAGVIDGPRYKAAIDLKVKELAEKWGNPGPIIFMEMVDMSVKSFYGTVMGFRIDNLIRNLFQPWAKATPELGWWEGTKYLGKAYLQMIKDSKKGGWKNVLKEAEDVYGIKPVNPRPEDFFGMREGITNSMEGKITRNVHQAIDYLSHGSMWAYMKTDEINRVATLNMVKSLVKDLKAGKQTKEVTKFRDNLPSSVKRNVDMIMEKPGFDEKELTGELARYLVAESQIIYGKVGRSEFHREAGSVIASLSDFPAAIVSETSYELRKDIKKGLMKLITKTFPALPAFYAMDLIADEVFPGEKNPTKRLIAGSGGFVGMHPIQSLPKFADVYMPPHLSNLAMVGANLIDGSSLKNKERVVKNFATTYTPVVGGLYRWSQTAERVVDTIEGEDGSKKRSRKRRSRRRSSGR